MDASLISAALGPCVALTSSIFYATGQQNRFTTVSGRVRELNREARELIAGGGKERARIASIKRQVETLTTRAALLHRALIMAYIGVTTFALTMLILLLFTALGWAGAAGVATLLFGAGLFALLFAMVTTVRELTLARVTLLEDVRSSFDGSDGASGGESSELTRPSEGA